MLAPNQSAWTGRAWALRAKARMKLQDSEGAIDDGKRGLVSLQNALGMQHPEVKGLKALLMALNENQGSVKTSQP